MRTSRGVWPLRVRLQRRILGDCRQERLGAGLLGSALARRAIGAAAGGGAGQARGEAVVQVWVCLPPARGRCTLQKCSMLASQVMPGRAAAILCKTQAGAPRSHLSSAGSIML